MNSRQNIKLGDVLCDIGKYAATAVPLTYFFSDKPGMPYVTVGAVMFSLSFVCLGLYFVRRGEPAEVSGNARKRKIRLLRNATFTVEEQKQE